MGFTFLTTWRSSLLNGEIPRHPRAQLTRSTLYFYMLKPSFILTSRHVTKLVGHTTSVARNLSLSPTYIHIYKKTKSICKSLGCLLFTAQRKSLGCLLFTSQLDWMGIPWWDDVSHHVAFVIAQMEKTKSSANARAQRTHSTLYFYMLNLHSYSHLDMSPNKWGIQLL